MPVDVSGLAKTVDAACAEIDLLRQENAAYRDAMDELRIVLVSLMTVAEAFANRARMDYGALESDVRPLRNAIAVARHVLEKPEIAPAEVVAKLREAAAHVS